MEPLRALQMNGKENGNGSDVDIQNGHAVEHGIHQKLQNELQVLGLKIKQHDDNMKFLKTQKHKLDDSIVETQVKLGQYHSSTLASNGCSSGQNEENILEQILQHKSNAASVLCDLKVNHRAESSHLLLTKDVLGIVAMLGKVNDDNLSRLLSEYLGVEKMLAVVCKNYEAVKALETYDDEGHIVKTTGLHALAASTGKVLDGRYLVICLDKLRPYCGEFVADDPQRRLHLLKPRLPNGEFPHGFVGFAVNMIHVEANNLLYVTPKGHGLRETLFYNLFSRLHVYKTREDMLSALPCACDGAVSLDGGIVKGAGFFSLGESSTNVDIRFPKPVSIHGAYSCEKNEKQLNEMKWEKEKLLEDMKREQSLLDIARAHFEKKKQEFLICLAGDASRAYQQQFQGYKEPIPPR